MATRRQDVLLKGSPAQMGLIFATDVLAVQNAALWPVHLGALAKAIQR
jgi:hypothetical protein